MLTANNWCNGLAKTLLFLFYVYLPTDLITASLAMGCKGSPHWFSERYVYHKLDVCLSRHLRLFCEFFCWGFCTICVFTRYFLQSSATSSHPWKSAL
jgi:hypothetical protein